MAIVEVKVPQLSESVAEATLLQWKKKVGDAVAVDEILIEVETDKVVMEVPAPSAGVLVELVVADGATVAAELKKYPNASEVVWCQDEPQNQGAWFFVQHYIHENMLEGQKLGYSGRAASASPAVGYSHLHQEQQKALVEGAFGKLKGFVLTK